MFDKQKDDEEQKMELRYDHYEEEKEPSQSNEKQEVAKQYSINELVELGND